MTFLSAAVAFRTYYVKQTAAIPVSLQQKCRRNIQILALYHLWPWTCASLL